jgi:hypothetical protein
MPTNVIMSVVCPPGCIINKVEAAVIENRQHLVPISGMDCGQTKL